MTIGAVVALDDEAEALLSQMEIETILTVHGKPVYVGTAFGQDVQLVICDVGKVNAAVGASVLLSRGADVLLNFGVAGGLHDGTELTEVYLIDRAVQYDFDLTQLDGGEIGTLNGETENFIPLAVPALDFPRRALGTGDRFNDSPADHNLLVRLGADIRDMEGAAVAQVCKYAGVPCVSVKGISDMYGTGSTTEQFLKNKARALLNLKAFMPEIFHALELLDPYQNILR